MTADATEDPEVLTPIERFNEAKRLSDKIAKVLKLDDSHGKFAALQKLRRDRQALLAPVAARLVNAEFFNERDREQTAAYSRQARGRTASAR